MVIPVAIIVVIVVIFFGLIALGIIKHKLKRDDQMESQRRFAAREERNATTAIQRTRRSPPSYECSTMTTTPVRVNAESSLEQHPTDCDHLSITIPPPAYKDHRQDRRVQ